VVSDISNVLNEPNQSNPDSLVAVDQTVQSVMQESSTLDTSGSEGIGVVEGQVQVNDNDPNNPDPTPEAGLELSPAPGGGSLDTLVDPNGNFEMLVPLGQPSFDYANSDFYTYDTVSQEVSDAETVDLSDTSYTTPIALTALDPAGPTVSEEIVFFELSPDDPTQPINVTFWVNGFGSYLVTARCCNDDGSSDAQLSICVPIVESFASLAGTYSIANLSSSTQPWATEGSVVYYDLAPTGTFAIQDGPFASGFTEGCVPGVQP
jgi:hypothetical protein